LKLSRNNKHLYEPYFAAKCSKFCPKELVRVRIPIEFAFGKNQKFIFRIKKKFIKLILLFVKIKKKSSDNNENQYIIYQRSYK